MAVAIVGMAFVVIACLAPIVTFRGVPRQAIQEFDQVQHTGEIEMRMRNGPIAMSTGVLLQTAQSLAAAQGLPGAVEWRLADGGNGHWYEVVQVSGAIPWADARLGAQSRGGDLATFTTQAENTFFVESHANVNGVTPWIGLWQNRLVPEYAEPSGGWRWVSGEDLSWTNWNTGEPNDAWGQGEDWANIWINLAVPGRWNDYKPDYAGGVPNGYVIEWSADCNADGIVDFGQIRDGSLADTNGNNIPDCCEQGISCTPCVADLDDSGAVNSVDLAIILAAWGTNGGKYPQADIDGSGNVDATDLSEVLAGWGPCTD